MGSTERTTVTLDRDAAALLDEQPPREGSRYLSRLLVAGHRRAFAALDYLVSSGWTRAALGRACASLNGTPLEHPLASSSEGMAGELATIEGVDAAWLARCEALRRDPLQGPALAEVVTAYWCGEARTVAAVDTGKGLRRG